MLSGELRAQIRHLFYAEHWKVGTIAQQLGVHPDTVRHALGTEQFNRAKASYRRLSTLADAVNRASETEGVFAPSQLGGAAKANAKKFDGSIASASGNRPFFELQRPAQKVLPSKVPDSGTAGRLALVAAAEAEAHDDSALREQLLEAQMRLELGELSEEEFAEIERDILARVRAMKADSGGLTMTSGTKVAGVEATVADELNQRHE